MRIKKIAQSIGVIGKILNAKSTSQVNTYSCDYINNFSGGDTLPIGSIVPYGSNAVPSNWLECDGSAVSRTTYDKLFSIIGTTYGSGDGSTTFNLPNLKGRVPVGKDASQTEFDTIGETGGEKTHRLTDEESGIREHTHQLPLSTNAGVGSYDDLTYRAKVAGEGQVDYEFRTGRTTALSDLPNDYGSIFIQGTDNKNAVYAHNNLQPYQVIKYIIKVDYTNYTSDTSIVQNTYTDNTNDTYSCDYVNKINNYSETEQVIGTWIDGKPVYRKVYTGYTPTSSGGVLFSITNGEELVNLYGFINNWLNDRIPLNWWNSVNDNCRVHANSVNPIEIALDGTIAYLGYPYKIVIEYTKTTD